MPEATGRDESTADLEIAAARRHESRQGRLAAAAILVLCLARLFLMGDLPSYARDLPVDDFLYARGAEAIVEGRWLGDYDENTLVKMPGYPLWLAALRLGGIPVGLGRELLWIAACLALYRGARRLGLTRATAIALFGVTLWHPVAAWSITGMLVRETIHHSQMLLILSLLAGFMARRSTGGRIFAALGLAVVTTFTWYSREESLWLLGVFAFGLAPVFLLERRRATLGAALRSRRLPASECAGHRGGECRGYAPRGR